MATPIGSYRDLVVWQRAIELTREVYLLTGNMPDSERYGLRAQMQRASVSVASNIAEGQGRATRGEFRHFLGVARGSLYEVDTQLTIALDLGFVTQQDTAATHALVEEVGKMLNALMRSLNAPNPKR